MVNRHSHAFVLSDYEARGLMYFSFLSFRTGNAEGAEKEAEKEEEKLANADVDDDEDDNGTSFSPQQLDDHVADPRPTSRARFRLESPSPPPVSSENLLHKRTDTSSTVVTEILAPLPHSPPPPPQTWPNAAENAKEKDDYTADVNGGSSGKRSSQAIKTEPNESSIQVPTSPKNDVCHGDMTTTAAVVEDVHVNLSLPPHHDARASFLSHTSNDTTTTQCRNSSETIIYTPEIYSTPPQTPQGQRLSSSSANDVSALSYFQRPPTPPLTPGKEPSLPPSPPCSTVNPPASSRKAARSVSFSEPLEGKDGEGLLEPEAAAPAPSPTLPHQVDGARMKTPIEILSTSASRDWTMIDPRLVTATSSQTIRPPADVPRPKTSTGIASTPSSSSSLNSKMISPQLNTVSSSQTIRPPAEVSRPKTSTGIATVSHTSTIVYPPPTPVIPSRTLEPPPDVIRPNPPTGIATTSHPSTILYPRAATITPSRTLQPPADVFRPKTSTGIASASSSRASTIIHHAIDSHGLDFHRRFARNYSQSSLSSESSTQTDQQEDSRQVESIPEPLFFDDPPSSNSNFDLPAILASKIDYNILPWESPNYNTTFPSTLRRPLSPSASLRSSFDSAAPPPISLTRFTANPILNQTKSAPTHLRHSPPSPTTKYYTSKSHRSLPKSLSSLFSRNYHPRRPSPLISIPYTTTLPGKPPVEVSVSRTSIPSIPSLFTKHKGAWPLVEPSATPSPTPTERGLRVKTRLRSLTSSLKRPVFTPPLPPAGSKKDGGRATGVGSAVQTRPGSIFDSSDEDEQEEDDGGLRAGSSIAEPIPASTITAGQADPSTLPLQEYFEYPAAAPPPTTTEPAEAVQQRQSVSSDEARDRVGSLELVERWATGEVAPGLI